MSNFLALSYLVGTEGVANAPFRDRVARLQQLLHRPAGKFHETTWASVATFARDNGTATPLVVDEQTGDWVAAAGTWFHRDGAASGNEEELLVRYRAVGAQRLAQELEGFFCIIIGDRRAGELIAITDIAGSFHVFVRALDNGVLLCGSSLGLAALGSCTLDTVGYQEFLRTGVIYEDRTFFREVRKLGPSRIYRFRGDALVSEARYWRIEEVATGVLEGRAAVDTLWQTLVGAVQRIGAVFPRVVCDLTAGYDSRTLVAAARASGLPFETTVSGSPDSADVKLSSGLAAQCGLAHWIMPDEPVTLDQVRRALRYTDGEFDLVEYARILQIHSALRARFDISLNGSYGEVARGYWWELLVPRVGVRRALDAGHVARARFAVEPIAPTWLPTSNIIDLATHFTEVVERAGVGLANLPNTAQMDNVYLNLRMQRWQGRIGSSTNRIWPCLSPFMFRSVLEAMLAVAPSQRRGSLLVRQLLLAYQPSMANFPLEHGVPAIPLSLRTAHRFLPLIPFYSRKVWHRAARRFRGKGSTPAASAPSVNTQIQHELESGRSEVARIFGCKEMENVLRMSKSNSMSTPLSRIYSLECALQALRSVDSNVEV